MGNLFLRADEVQQILGVSKSYAYKVIKEMNSELQRQGYIDSLYGVTDSDRIFPISKSYLHHEMDRGTKAAGVKRIPIHSIRHRHISLLIDLGFSAVAIANRVGHESIDITYNYAHMFPSTQLDMANKLNEERGEDNG